MLLFLFLFTTVKKVKKQAQIVIVAESSGEKRGRGSQFFCKGTFYNDLPLSLPPKKNTETYCFPLSSPFASTFFTVFSSFPFQIFY